MKAMDSLTYISIDGNEVNLNQLEETLCNTTMAMHAVRGLFLEALPQMALDGTQSARMTLIEMAMDQIIFRVEQILPDVINNESLCRKYSDNGGDK